MALIKDVHHIAIKCKDDAQFAKDIEFYTECLGLPVIRSWGEGDDAGIMIGTANLVIEIFARGCVSNETGAVNHFALATDDVAGCLDAVRAFGCKVTMETNNIVIPSEIPFPATIGFCVGPAGEEIEFFCEK